MLHRTLTLTVLKEPPTIAIGSPRPPELWSPLIDTTLPEDQRLQAFVPYITGYFKHGDLASRDSSAISWCVPALFRVPSAYNMSEKEMAETVYFAAGGNDSMYFLLGEAAIQDAYKKACYDTTTRAIFPGMKIWVLCGDVTTGHGIPALWSIQDDNEANGGGFINLKWVPGANHTVSKYSNCITTITEVFYYSTSGTSLNTC